MQLFRVSAQVWDICTVYYEALSLLAVFLLEMGDISSKYTFAFHTH